MINGIRRVRLGVAVLGALLGLALGQSASADEKITAHDAHVGGATIHYLISSGFVSATSLSQSL